MFEPWFRVRSVSFHDYVTVSFCDGRKWYFRGYGAAQIAEQARRRMRWALDGRTPYLLSPGSYRVAGSYRYNEVLGCPWRCGWIAPWTNASRTTEVLTATYSSVFYARRRIHQPASPSHRCAVRSSHRLAETVGLATAPRRCSRTRGLRPGNGSGSPAAGGVR
jgi:hypothetical protein